MRKYLGFSLFLVLFAALAITQSGCQKKAPQPVQPAAETSIFSSGNVYGVGSQPINPTVFTVNESYKITYISDYHYLNHGTPPGTIALQHQDGTLYGPWQAEGVPGQDGVPNVSWVVRPNTVIKPGTYTVIDSNPSTWSQNDQSQNRGFSAILGYKAQ